MHLTSIEIQGFKTFAKKTVIKLPTPTTENRAITVVVGPNGSGKSNLTDAIRWCLGEQSMKQLRGKKSDDIIFSGAESKGRSNFAEVILTFDNTDSKIALDFAEITITRRLYRDGNSEYLLNQKPARLQDIQLLLAEAGIGQRTYTVIGQGMIDHILTSSPEERKVFFDDATGVRGYQIKRHQAYLKLEKSHQHILDVERLLSEIEPRLKLLQKQVDRLKERKQVESELKNIQTIYFGFSKQEIRSEMLNTKNDQQALQLQIDEVTNKISAGDEKLAELEKSVKEKNSSAEQDRSAKRQAHHEALQVLRLAERDKFEAERAIEIAKVSAQSKWSPLPLTKIVEELTSIEKKHLENINLLKNAKSIEEIGKITQEIEENSHSVSNLLSRLKRPQPEDFQADQSLLDALELADNKVTEAKNLVEEREKEVYERRDQKLSQTEEIFGVQREVRQAQQELHSLEAKLHHLDIQLAKLETRDQNLTQEIHEQFIGNITDLDQHFEKPAEHLELIRSQMQRLQHKRDLIGAIDPKVIEEFTETEERFNFLNSQSKDIREAIKATSELIDELDDRIEIDGNKAFKQINSSFNEYFKVLFGGGKAELIQLTQDESTQTENDTALTRALEAVAEEALEEKASNSLSQKTQRVLGIDILATPPGKNLKALNLLSGGEKALTSIALLSAILSTNPSPFIVLDEVDAALDETNTLRFAQILNKLQTKTQFIVITHNRATMEQADVLYGVTMGGDGISNIISVKLTDISENGTSRR